MTKVGTNPVITTDGHTLVMVRNFTYPGYTISNILVAEIASMIGNVAAAMARLDKRV